MNNKNNQFGTTPIITTNKLNANLTQLSSTVSPLNLT